MVTLQDEVFVRMGQNMKREIQSRIMIVVEKVKEEKYFYCVVEVKGRNDSKQSSGELSLTKDNVAHNLTERVCVCLASC